jgi:hypothetical protein
VTICIQWNQRMKLYSFIFSFIQYPLSFATNVACNLFKVTKNILGTNVLCGWKHGKVCQWEILFFLVENIEKLKLNTLNSWIFFTLMINKRKIFDLIAKYLILACFNMHLNIYLKIQVQENRCHYPTSTIWKCDENTIIIEFFVLSDGKNTNVY